jgi:hypothetical protein
LEGLNKIAINMRPLVVPEHLVSGDFLQTFPMLSVFTTSICHNYSTSNENETGSNEEKLILRIDIFTVGEYKHCVVLVYGCRVVR